MINIDINIIIIIIIIIIISLSIFISCYSELRRELNFVFGRYFLNVNFMMYLLCTGPYCAICLHSTLTTMHTHLILI